MSKMKQQIYTLIIISLILSLSLISAAEDTILLGETGEEEISFWQRIINWLFGLDKDTSINNKEDNNIKLLEDKTESEITKSHKNDTIFSEIKKVFIPEPERREECVSAFNYANGLRIENGRRKIEWDDRAYNLGVARTKDMYEKEYFDHVSPSGECAYNMKKDYGFKDHEDLAENAGAIVWDDGSYTKKINPKNQVDGWMNSRGHRYNLLYPEHNSGAISCYYGVCVFLGVNNDRFGEGCHTAEEGESFWASEQRMSDEIIGYDLPEIEIDLPDLEIETTDYDEPYCPPLTESELRNCKSIVRDSRCPKSQTEMRCQ